MNFVNILILVSLTLTSSCTVLSKDLKIYSHKKMISSGQKVTVSTDTKSINEEHCSRLLLFIPLSRPMNQFDLIEAVIDNNPGYNGLINAKIETSFFTLGLYHSVCNKLSGELAKFE